MPRSSCDSIYRTAFFLVAEERSKRLRFHFTALALLPLLNFAMRNEPHPSTYRWLQALLGYAVPTCSHVTNCMSVPLPGQAGGRRRDVQGAAERKAQKQGVETDGDKGANITWLPLRSFLRSTTVLHPVHVDLLSCQALQYFLATRC